VHGSPRAFCHFLSGFSSLTDVVYSMKIWIYCLQIKDSKYRVTTALHRTMYNCASYFVKCTRNKCIHLICYLMTLSHLRKSHRIEREDSGEWLFALLQALCRVILNYCRGSVAYNFQTGNNKMKLPFWDMTSYFLPDIIAASTALPNKIFWITLSFSISFFPV
jgi:hypothetical protein